MLFLSFLDSKHYEKFYTMNDDDDDDEKDAYYGCSCQRYLCVGLLMPALLSIAALGLFLMLLSKICK